MSCLAHDNFSYSLASAMTMGERIRARLQALDISQAELARRVGIKQPTINALINGSSRSSVHLHKIARELRTTSAFLAGDTDDPDAEVPIDNLTAEERVSLEQLRQLNDRDRKAVLQLLRSLTEEPTPATVHEPKLKYRS